MQIKNMFVKLPDLLLAQLLSFSFIYALTDSLCLKYPALNIFILSALFMTLYHIVFFNKHTIKAAAVFAIILFLVSGYIVAFIIGWIKCNEFCDNYFFWLTNYIDTTSNLVQLYQIITVLFLCAIISIYVYLFTVRKFLFSIMVTTGAALFAVQWSYEIISSLSPFYFFLFAILLYYLRHINIRKSLQASNEFVHNGVFIIWTIPICILVVSIASIIHVNNKPIEWKWLDRKINSVYSYLNKRYDYEIFDYFSVSSSGFGERNNLLGGRVKLDKTLVLTVETPRNVYLKGASNDQYTGSKWISGNNKLSSIGNNYNSLFVDTSEMVAGMMLLTGKTDYLDKYFYKDKIKISFKNLKTKSVFIPLKISVFTPINKLNGFVDFNGSLSSSKRLDSNFKYSVDLYSPKIGGTDFTDILKKSKIGLYKDYLIASNTSRNPYMDSIKKLADNADNIYSKYLQLPDKLPQRVYDLAVSITANYNDNYEKAKAIEQYLASKFPYNLDVRSTPKTRDFVDYFLFDLKQGYCTYYASAMTVLARCCGIPARYVEGYILPPKPTEKNSNIYNVTNMQAHAWVEVYFEGYGWLPFEPTSPFRSAFYSDETIQSAISGDYNPAYNDYMDTLKKYGKNSNYDLTYNLSDTETQNVSQLFILLIVFGILLTIFILILVFNLSRSKYRLYKMMNLPPRQSVLHLYSYYVSTLTLQGLGIETGETPLQYARRIDAFLFFSPVKFKAITDIFVKCRYSLNDVTEKDKQILCDFHHSLVSETKENVNRFRYFILKNLFGKI